MGDPNRGVELMNSRGNQKIIPIVEWVQKSLRNQRRDIYTIDRGIIELLTGADR